MNLRKKIFSIFIIAFIILASASFEHIDKFSVKNAYASQEDSTNDGANTEQTKKYNAPVIELPEIPDFSDYSVIETYGLDWSESLAYDIQYDRYSVFPHYVVNISTRKSIYKEPDTTSGRLDRIKYGEKMQAVAKIEDEDGDEWYAIVCEYEDEKAVGYIQESKVEKRTFQMDEMTKYLNSLTDLHDLGHIVYVENYRYKNGRAPKLPNGSYYDEFGNRRGQAIAGYYDSTMDTGFRYIPDGTLAIVEQIIETTETEDEVIVINNEGIFKGRQDYKEYFDDIKIEDDEDFDPIEEYNKNTEVTAVKIYIPSFGVSLWVKEKYISEDKKSPDILNQAIIVDRLNQTIVVFEYEERWKVISMNYSSTGKIGEYSLPTPLGFYMAIEKKPKFDYVEDGTTKIVGYAPYAIRFSAGGYLHGVPMEYGFTETGKRTTPVSNQEYLASIGTIPRSHMCVRNYTSHAEFMYDWVDIGNCAIIVIE